jgi:hypothetical protein
MPHDWQHGAPLVAAAHHIEVGIDDLAPAVARGASTGLDGWHKRFKHSPLGSAQVARMGFAHGGALVQLLLLHAASLAQYPLSKQFRRAGDISESLLVWHAVSIPQGPRESTPVER